VIKVLKETKIERVNREIMTMLHLKGGPNIVNLIEVIRDPNTTNPGLVMDFVDNHNISFKDLFKNFTDFDVRYYMY
jgi:casein kinase II subunit alpha